MCSNAAEESVHMQIQHANDAVPVFLNECHWARSTAVDLVVAVGCGLAYVPRSAIGRAVRVTIVIWHGRVAWRADGWMERGVDGSR